MSLVLVLLFLTGFMSVFISENACEHSCCKKELNCCSQVKEIASCSMSQGENVSSPTLIASGPKPPKWRPVASFSHLSTQFSFDNTDETIPVFLLPHEHKIIPLYTFLRTLLI